VELRILQSRALGMAAGLTVFAMVCPARAQDWAIHLYGHVEPVKASFYAEETPWVFFRDDDSHYVFSVGCDRVERVERDGTAIAPPFCPVERLPTSMPLVYSEIMNAEDKRREDLSAQLREQMRARAQAVVATSAASGQPAGPSEMELARQTQDTMMEIRRSNDRISALIEASRLYPPRERQRFYFFSR
jgi:hypothetical protein